MKLIDFIKKYWQNGDKQTMWESVEAISDYIEDMRFYDEHRFCDLKKELFSIMQGSHYNEEFAEEQIDKMFYTDNRGVKHAAPYWTNDKMHEAYMRAKGSLPNTCTEHDFWVALNMMKSDYGNLIESWFPSGTDEKLIEMTVSYFNDPDSPNSDTKIWSYFNK